MQIRKIGTYLANLLKPEQLAENLRHTTMKEDGLRFGDDTAEVTGVLVCWMATAAAIKAAAHRHCNVIICHEDPYFQSFEVAVDLSAGWLANRERLRLLLRHDIAVYCCHSPLDVLYTMAAELDALQLDVKTLQRDWVSWIAEVPPLTIAELAERARQGFKVPLVQVIGDPNRTVTRVGLSGGGMGLSFNSGYQEAHRRNGAEAIVTGEVDDYGAFWAEESGVAMIAVGHAENENPGLRRFVECLKIDFPGLPAHFFECRTPGRMMGSMKRDS